MEEKSTAFAEFDNNSLTRRRNLLPTWIKVFLWFFLIGSAISAILLIAGSLLTHISLSIYGISATHPYSMTGLLICFLFLFKGPKISFLYRLLKIPYKQLQFNKSLFYAKKLIRLIENF